MNLQQLQAAQSIMNEVQKLDAEIVAIDKLAMQIAQGNCEVKLTLSVKDTSKVVKQPVTDDDGSLIQPYQSIMDRMLGYSPLRIDPWGSVKPDKPKDTTDHSHNISDSVTLGILGVLLCDKQEKRNKLMVKLSRMGVTV